nr:unnamed protein product [Digitaria exilis]
MRSTPPTADRIHPPELHYARAGRPHPRLSSSLADRIHPPEPANVERIFFGGNPDNHPPPLSLLYFFLSSSTVPALDFPLVLARVGSRGVEKMPGLSAAAF